MKISIIVAVAENGVIGRDNGLIWHLPADLKYFKSLTMGHPIIMGRKTYESIGKPLPGRTTVIITHNPEYKAEGCIVVHSLEAAIEAARGFDEIFITGGEHIYRLAMPLADKLYYTKVHAAFEGDAYFPEVNPDEWTLVSCTDHEADEKNAYGYSFMVYNKVR